MASSLPFTKYSFALDHDANSCTNGSADANDFGPVSRHCDDGFDFTLLFEQSFLSLVPSAIFIIAVLWRSWYLLSSRTQKVKRNVLWALKLGSIIALGALQLALVVLWSQNASFQTRIAIAAAVLALADVLALCLISNAEHTGSVRTSTVINAWLFFSTIFDAVQCRTLWLLRLDGALPAVFSASVGAKVLVLLLELQGKDSSLVANFRGLSPETTGGMFTRTLFWWLNPLLILGSRSRIKLDDLFPMSPEFSGEVVGPRMEKIWSKSNKTRRFALLQATCSAIRWPLISAIFPRFCLIGFKFAQPFLLNTAVSYVAEKQSDPGNTSKAVGYGLIASTAMIYVGLAVCTGAYKHHTYRAITMIRGSLVMIIFRKTLGLDDNNSSDNAASVTLMSTDIDGIASAFDAIHDIWAGLIEVALGLWLLERHVGLACVAPALTALVCFLASLYLSRFMGRGRREWNQAVQKRITVTSAFLSLMKEVKMCGLTKVVTKRIQELRVAELDLSKKFRVMTAWTSFLSHATPILSPILTFGLYVVVQKTGIGNTLDVATAFSSLSLISLLTEPASNLFHGIPTFASGLGCFERIQEFLLSQASDAFSPVDVGIKNAVAASQQTSADQSLDSLEPQVVVNEKGTNPSDTLVDIKDASFGNKEDGNPIISSISLQIRQRSFVAVTGKVGSGKSSLLKAILGELPCSVGNIRRSFQDAAYCNQTPWLQNTTIRQNILGGPSFHFDENLYDAVIDACALKQDFLQLPEGDQTTVGSDGAVLSGGQKQRVTLARALYSHKKLMLIDNVFSGLDSATADHVFDMVFGSGGLKDTLGIAVVLVTSNSRHLQVADTVLVIDDNGSLVECDAFSRLKDQEKYMAQNSTDSGHTTPAKELLESKAKPKPTRPPMDHIVRRNKEIDANRQSGETAVYLYYLKAVAWLNGILLLTLGALSAFCDKFPTVWLDWWVQDSEDHPGKNGFYFGIYAMFGVLSLILVFLLVWHMFVRIVPSSSQRLHKQLLDTVMRAPLSFSLETDIGVTLNRFSQDMTLVDMALPPAIFLTLISVLNCIGGGVMVIIGAKYLAALVPVAIAAIYGLQKFYLRTSRQLRFLDLEAKSPLYTHFLETLKGLTTIRAYGWGATFEESNTRLLASSQRPYYLMFCIQRWLNLVLDMLVAALAVLLITFAVTLSDATSSGALGVAMINLLTFNQDLASLIDSWTKMETSLGAIARLRDLEKEVPHAPRDPYPRNEWSFRRRLEFKQVSASYGAEKPLVLSQISFAVDHGKTVAVCGRTGSGKSSLMLCLLGLLEIRHGSISIDDVDLSTIPAEVVHEHIIVIAQNMPLLPGSVRFNLCPREYVDGGKGPVSDEIMISALKSVGLWGKIMERGGLDIDESDLSLSGGQQQLFSVALALVQKHRLESSRGRQGHGGIIVLDEANSNVDMEASLLMQRLLQENFGRCGWTTLVVTHRAETMRAADEVIILDAGSVIRSANPDNVVVEEAELVLPFASDR